MTKFNFAIFAISLGISSSTLLYSSLSNAFFFVVPIQTKQSLPIISSLWFCKLLKSKPHSIVVKKLGMACSYPGTFNSSIHSIINSTNYRGAVLRAIKAGGCNCSRVNFIGAYFAALKGIDSIPKSWIKKTESAKKILKQK